MAFVKTTGKDFIKGHRARVSGKTFVKQTVHKFKRAEPVREPTNSPPQEPSMRKYGAPARVLEREQMTTTEQPKPAQSRIVHPAKVIHKDLTQVHNDVGARAWFETMLRKARDEGVFMVQQTLTPALAKLLLGDNKDNRNFIKAKINEYTHAMRAGKFDGLNGDTLKIALSGELNDGQNRCQAVLNARAEIETCFVFGLTRESRLTIDQGAPRRARDYLAMSGYLSNATLTYVANMLYSWRHYRVLRPNPEMRITASELAEYTRANHEQIVASYQALPRKGMVRLGRTHLFVFCHLLFAEKDLSAANQFISGVISGESLDGRSPMHVLREKLSAAGGPRREDRLNQEERFECFVRAWNAYCHGEKISRIVIRNSVPEIMYPKKLREIEPVREPAPIP